MGWNSEGITNVKCPKCGAKMTLMSGSWSEQPPDAFGLFCSRCNYFKEIDDDYGYELLFETKRNGRCNMLLAIDPGSNLGYAIFNRDGNLIKHGVMKNYKLNDIIELLEEYKPDVAIESQYVKFNVHSYERLITIRTAIEILTILGNNVVYRVYPIQWQRWIGITHGTKRKEAKRLAKEYVMRRYKNIKLMQDEIDAIIIGLYVLHNYDKIPVLDKDNYFT